MIAIFFEKVSELFYCARLGFRVDFIRPVLAKHFFTSYKRIIEKIIETEILSLHLFKSVKLCVKNLFLFLVVPFWRRRKGGEFLF